MPEYLDWFLCEKPARSLGFYGSFLGVGRGEEGGEREGGGKAGREGGNEKREGERKEGGREGGRKEGGREGGRKGGDRMIHVHVHPCFMYMYRRFEPSRLGCLGSSVGRALD